MQSIHVFDDFNRDYQLKGIDLLKFSSVYKITLSERKVFPFFMLLVLTFGFFRAYCVEVVQKSYSNRRGTNELI